MTELEYWKEVLNLRDRDFLLVPFSKNKQDFELWANCNNLFAYACSDADPLGNITISEVSDLLEKFGCEGLYAYLARERGYDPLPSYLNEKYYQAKKYLKDWVSTGPVVFPESSETELEQIKEIKRLLWLWNHGVLDACALAGGESEIETNYSVFTTVLDQRWYFLFGNDMLTEKRIGNPRKPERTFRDLKNKYLVSGLSGLIRDECTRRDCLLPDFV